LSLAIVFLLDFDKAFLKLLWKVLIFIEFQWTLQSHMVLSFAVWCEKEELMFIHLKCRSETL